MTAVFLKYPYSSALESLVPESNKISCVLIGSIKIVQKQLKFKILYTVKTLKTGPCQDF
jgi:hypothetical protein